MRTNRTRGSVWPLFGYVAALIALLVLWRVIRPADRDDTQPTAVPTAEAPAAALPHQDKAAGADLGAVERNTIAIYKRASSSVVSVANRALVRDFFGFHVYEVPQGAGSGFVWDKQGHIISNFHVIYKASAVSVTLRDGTRYDAKLVGADPDHDIAVLKIEAPAGSLVPLAIGTSRDLRVGQKVLAIGNPFGLDTSLSVGVVSALGRSIVSLTSRRIQDVIQTDAAINPGNSGGPLLDSAGRVIGINTAILSPSGSHAGIGFAVPVDTVRRVVPQLITHGKVRRAGMGIQIVPDNVSREYGIEGVAILRAFPGSAAARAGLRGVRQSLGGRVALGDVLVEVDGKRVACNDELLAILDEHKAGDRVQVVCARNGKRRTVVVALQDLD